MDEICWDSSEERSAGGTEPRRSRNDALLESARERKSVLDIRANEKLRVFTSSSVSLISQQKQNFPKRSGWKLSREASSLSAIFTSSAIPVKGSEDAFAVRKSFPSGRVNRTEKGWRAREKLFRPPENGPEWRNNNGKYKYRIYNGVGKWFSLLSKPLNELEFISSVYDT